MTITPHALQRYLSRSGTNGAKGRGVARASEFLFSVAEHGLRLPCNRRYYRGWVVVVIGDQIVTAYKPHKREVQDEVYDAVNKKR